MPTISTTAIARQSWAIFQKHWMLFIQCAVIVSLPLIFIPPLGSALTNYCSTECSEKTVSMLALFVSLIFGIASFILKTSALNIFFLLYEGKTVTWATMFDFKKHKNFIFRYLMFLLQLSVVSLILALGVSLIIGIPLNYLGITTSTLIMKITELIPASIIVNKIIFVLGTLLLTFITFSIGIKIAYGLFDYTEHTSRSFIQSLKQSYKITCHQTFYIILYHIKALYFYTLVLIPLFIVYGITIVFPITNFLSIIIYSLWSAISVFHSICIYKALSK